MTLNKDKWHHPPITVVIYGVRCIHNINFHKIEEALEYFKRVSISYNKKQEDDKLKKDC